MPFVIVMPFVFVDELGEGQEEAEVYSPDEYNALMMERRVWHIPP